jgi:anthranilate phosphoribosyltransferase
LIGVYARDWVEPLADALARLGADRVWVVYGDGLDEIATSGPTRVAMLAEGKVTVREIGPEDAGLSWSPLSALAGGTATENAAALKRLLEGETGAYRDIVLINSAAALVIGGKVQDLKEGVVLASAAIDDGAAKEKLDALITISNVRS